MDLPEAGIVIDLVRQPDDARHPGERGRDDHALRRDSKDGDALDDLGIEPSELLELERRPLAAEPGRRHEEHSGVAGGDRALDVGLQPAASGQRGLVQPRVDAGVAKPRGG